MDFFSFGRTQGRDPFCVLCRGAGVRISVKELEGAYNSAPNTIVTCNNEGELKCAGHSKTGQSQKASYCIIPFTWFFGKAKL